MRHSAYKRETCTFINVNIKVINTILKVNRDNRQTLKCKTLFINIFMIRQTLMRLYTQLSVVYIYFD